MTINIPEPTPVGNDLPHVWDLVIEDMKARDEFGFQKYGVHLQPNNGRNNLIDAYFEILDLAVYIRSKIYEETGE